MMSFMGRRQMIMIIAAVVILSLTSSGCETLRKKFTRTKKKAETEDRGFVPVLEPEDYPAPQENPVENYKQHYSLIKVWYKDLWNSIDEKFSEKKIRYTLKQIYDHIDEMKKLLHEESRADLDQLKALLKYFDDSLSNPWAMRNVSRIQSDLRAFHRQLRGKLSIGKVKKQLTPIKK